MRIVGGKRRGLKLAAVAAPGIRPTADRVRQALFDMLAHDPALATEAGPCPAGQRVLDVFAGVGALGLEAWSRGAGETVFVEKAAAAITLLQANIARAGAGETTRILRRDALAPGPSSLAAELVFMDPPYGVGLPAPAIRALDAGGWLAPDCLIIVECDRRESFEAPSGFSMRRDRSFGRSRLCFLSRG